MNCQQVQDLMPLYVGNDLEERRAWLVTAHVQKCEACSVTAREYRETRQLIETFVPPAFTEDFYAEMRQGVWENIEKKSTRPEIFSIVAGLFRPRLAWALATAVLIAVSAIGFYVVSRRVRAPQPVVSHPPPASTTPNEQPDTSSPNSGSSRSLLASSGSNSRPTGINQPDRRQKRKAVSDRVNIRAESTIAAALPAVTSAPQASDLRQSANGSSEASPAPLRVEIQTKNPNIRIIWFASRDTKQLSPNSKGT
jgi:putative zinc finger protein